MAAIARPLRHSLGGRLFVLCGGLVLGTMIAAVGFTAWRAGQEADQWVRETLAASSSAQGRIERRRAGQLRLMTRFVAADPAFAAYAAEADPASVRDLVLERRREVECDFMAVLDPRGRTIARTDRPGAAGEDLSANPLVTVALSRGEAYGLWTDGDNVATAVIVPILAGQEALLGLLVAGLAVDEALALDVRRGSGAEVAYVALGASPRVIASTLGENPALLKTVAREAAARRNRTEPVRLTVDGRTWAVQVAPLAASDETGDRADERRGGQVMAVTLASLDQVLAPFRRIEQALIAVGLVSLFGAFGISWALTRRVAKPIQQLALAAEAAREGRYDQALPVAGADEVGRLARAFKSLMGELREERETEAYLGALSRSLPEAPPAREDGGLAPGALLADRFEIVSLLGSGGYGTVYKARDRQLQDTVAVKALHPGVTSPEALEGLKDELRIARRISHRNVLRTHDFGDANGVAFISMEFVRGITLREVLNHTARLPASVALRLARQLLAGVEAAHRTGVVHHDLKPENLMLDPTGLLRIMDFGIAHAARSRARLTAEPELRGTPGYLAPEQLRGEPGDVRSDLYACGTVLYEMLAGRRPFGTLDFNQLAFQVTSSDPPDLAEVAPGTPAGVSRAVMKCLARDPAARWASAAELLAALDEAET